MSTTMFLEGSVTRTWGGKPTSQCSDTLLKEYHEVLGLDYFQTDECLKFIRQLGSGGQGIVFLSERIGCDGFVLPIAVKVFTPERYENDTGYSEAMLQLANVAAQVSCIQHDNLLDVHNWVAHRGIRMMEMEWIDGFDMNWLLRRQTLTQLKEQVSDERFSYISEVIITDGPIHSRVKPGIAIAIIRECLGALAALHRNGVIHGDVKPANIMLKRTGHAKIVDIGSAFHQDNPPKKRTCTPAYAAPEVLEEGEITPQSDLASLGYVLIDMLSGTPPFDNRSNLKELLEAKRSLHLNLHNILPKELVSSELLMNFCRSLIAPDPNLRFPSAEAADLFKEGAADFHRQLVKGDLASEYGNEIRLWLEEFKD
ncbi:MAG: serine/threonine-protein kinase [Thermoguttaceae bacterium]